MRMQLRLNRHLSVLKDWRQENTNQESMKSCLKTAYSKTGGYKETIYVKYSAMV